MHISWLSIVVLLVVFIVGPLLCARLSKDIHQRRAALIAFALLFVLWVIFFIAVELMSQHSFMPFLAVASIVLPLVLYFVLMQIETLRATRATAVAADATEPPVIKTVTWKEVIEQQEQRRELSHQPKQESHRSGDTELPELRDLTPEGEYLLRPDEDAKAQASHLRTPQETEQEYWKLRETVAHESTEDKSSPLYVELPLESVDTEEVVLTVEEPQVFDEPEDKQAMIVETEEEAPSAQVSYDAIYGKAESCATREMWPLAAVLYEESAGHASSTKDKQAALFSAMSAYLKSKKPGDVKRIADELAACEDLSSAQKIKLATIQKMLS